MTTPREVLANRKRYQGWLSYYRPTKYTIKQSAGLVEDIEYHDATEENRKKLSSFDPKKLWSICEGDDGRTILVSGLFHHKEVISWIVTERTWFGEPGSMSWDLETIVYCKKCDGDGQTKTGKPCEKCDGVGYKIYDSTSN